MDGRERFPVRRPIGARAVGIRDVVASDQVAERKAARRERSTSQLVAEELVQLLRGGMTVLRDDREAVVRARDGDTAQVIAGAGLQTIARQRRDVRQEQRGLVDDEQAFEIAERVRDPGGNAQDPGAVGVKRERDPVAPCGRVRPAPARATTTRP